MLLRSGKNWLLSVALLVSSSALAEVSKEVRAAAEANNEFAVGLLKSVKKDQLTGLGNKVVSPISAYYALSMALNGATGETADEMSAVLGLSRLTREKLNAANGALLRQLISNKINDDHEGYRLILANSLWGNSAERAEIREDFVTRVKDVYQAEAQFLNFRSADTLKTINNWVSIHTKDKPADEKGKVTKILDKLNATDLLVLINATYLKGSWKFPFSEKMTQRGVKFSTAQGKKVDVEMMKQTFHAKYLNEDGVEAIELPAGSSQRSEKAAPLSAIVILPKDLEKYERSLTTKSLETLLLRLSEKESAEGSLAIPKVKLGYNITLNENLKKFDEQRKLGMPRAFEGNAQFSDLASGTVFISLVKQSAFLSMDEKGLEAAAATAVSFGRGLPRPTFNMKVDRPYLLLVRDNATNALLFLASVSEPSLTDKN